MDLVFQQLKHDFYEDLINLNYDQEIINEKIVLTFPINSDHIYKYNQFMKKYEFLFKMHSLYNKKFILNSDDSEEVITKKILMLHGLANFLYEKIK
jgi:hypothetical protein